ncbi:MAG: hypothetical protein ACFCUE_15575 [Candidatus Bathyarchaeia archaeon]
MSLTKNKLIRKCLLFLAILSSATIELAILLTFLNMYSVIAIELYWTGLIALIAGFLVSIALMQTIVEIKCEHYDNQLKAPQTPK